MNVMSTISTDEIQYRIDHMKAAIEACAPRVGPTKALEQNREALKTLMYELLNDLAGLVHEAGGDSLYIPDRTYFSDDIDRAFSDAIEAEDRAEPAPNYKQYSTLDRKTQGLMVVGASL